MIIDVHTHLWDVELHIGNRFKEEARKSRTDLTSIDATPEIHRNAMQDVDVAIVLAFDAPHSGVVVPNDYVAEYVKSDPERLIGFLSVDPNSSGALEEVERSVHDLGLKGIKLAPMYQDFHPQDRERAYPIYEMAERLGLPILFHMGTTFTSNSKLQYTTPILLEEVAQAFPDLRIVIAHLAHPWEAETIVLIRKQPNVFADISALYYRPWQMYNSLRLAVEYGVTHKLLFGTDFPFTTARPTIDGLASIVDWSKRASLPEIPAEIIDEIICRKDTLELLGLEKAG